MTVEMKRRVMIALCGLAAILLLLGTLGWMQRATIAVWLAPEKIAAAESAGQSRRANDRFWDALHGGRYEELPGVIEALTAAYLENPRDAETAAHLARRYFAEAVRLAPTDERFKGFLASMELAEAKIHGDEKLLRLGYFNLMASGDGWPEFNLFPAGYVLSGLPFTDPMYAEAV